MQGRAKFPRRERLTKRREFLEVYEHAGKTAGREFICYVAQQEGRGRKLGLAVSRKVGNAVVRNRVKRYIREVYRTHRAEFADDIYIVIIARPSAAKLGYRECEEALCGLFRSGEAFRA